MPFYTETGDNIVHQRSKTKILFSDLTSKVEGKDLGELKQIWVDTAASEVRLNLMSALMGKKIGLREIENFGLGLKYNFKSDKFKELKDKPIEEVVQAAMKVKLRDEQHHHKELVREKNLKRKRLGEKHHPKTYTYRKIIRYLRQEAEETKRNQGEKHRKKVEHLESIYREPVEEQLAAPESMKEYEHLSVFSDLRYSEIPQAEVQVPKIGNVILSKEEEKILRKSPKFALPQRLLEDTLKHEMEKAYSLVRMELRDEEEEVPTAEYKVNNTETNIAGKADEEEEERKRASKEEEAKSRQVYDPIEDEYDERRRRATDLVECARVTLPRPLSVKREAEIEMRREIHNRVFQEYRKEHCSKEGDQESNLDEEERKGLKSLQTRIKKENLIIMKTDKSGKLCATTEEQYEKMGREHVKEDTVVERDKIQETDKVMNEHSSAWCSMWRTGRNHDQEDRIVASKTSKSENRAKLYLSYKDHKKEEFKTRPIGTACSSNTRAFANSVSDLLESIANSEVKKYEVISTEDLLHHVWLYNRGLLERKISLRASKERRWKCFKERLWEKRCEKCESSREEEKDENPELRSIVEIIVEEVLKRAVDISEERRKRDECDDCQKKIYEEMRKECTECGLGVEEEEYVMVGMDAVSLFPSLSSRRTARTVGERVRKSSLKMNGFNWKKGILYIMMNKKLVTKISTRIKRYFPIRKSRQGTEPGMSSQGLKRKENAEDKQWFFYRKDPSEEEEKEMISYVLEIAVVILWENYCFDFGGRTYLQKQGGPIGQRPTMAASRIVIHQFFEEYEEVLLKAGLQVPLLKVYVDDGRQVTSLLRKGMRYSRDEKEFVWSKEAETEDEKKEEEGEGKAAFMARLCLPVMNSINEDLTFTAEVETDFENQKLPTLDTKLWMKEDGRLGHSYFEKEMKSQQMLCKSSAMSIKQKHCIMANEITRRLYNLDREDENLEKEVEEVIETFTKQSKNSGWDRKETREMVVNGFLGWKRRLERREEECGGSYRSAGNSLKTRARKKLTGKEDWYKESSKRKRVEEEEMEDEEVKKKGSSKRMRKEPTPKSNTIAVMFVPYTIGGSLARRLREEEEKLEKQTGYRIKIVERAGSKLVDLLHRANPWKGKDCERAGCLLCLTKMKTGKDMDQDCTQRCLVYESWCMTCEDKEIKRIEDDEEDEKTKNEKIRNIVKYVYIGETSRSIYERGLEHMNDKENLKKDSHMIKHYFDKHEGEELEKMEFGIKIVKNTKTAFDRQILESVLIQAKKKKHHILNSRSEYNRCALPRLTAKLGDDTYDKIDKIKKDEKKAEVELERKIRDMKIRNNKERRIDPSWRDQPASKKRKTNENEYKIVVQDEQKVEKRRELEEVPRTLLELRKEMIEKKDNPILYKKKRINDLEEEITEKKEKEVEEKVEIEKEKIDWEEKIREREDRIKMEDLERKKRIEKAARLEKSYELLRLCRETLKAEGETWQISKARRELEREKT